MRPPTFETPELQEKFSTFTQYLFKYYLTVEHKFGVLNQDHYSAFMNGDFDATNNCSETINRAIKQYSSTGKKTVFTVIRAIYEFKMDLGQKLIKRMKNPRKRCKKTTEKYETIMNLLSFFDNLPPEHQPNYFYSTLAVLGDL